MKNRKSIPQLSKVRAELQKEINSICPFCENTDVGHFEIHHIDEIPENNDIRNLILLCPICHSKITKKDITMQEVCEKKINLILGTSDNKKIESKIANYRNVKNSVIGNNNKVTFKSTKKEKYPPGCIGHDFIKANYVSHLVGRYNEYKEYDDGKGNVPYGRFSAELKRKYKVGHQRTIYNLPISKFEELIEYIQNRIDNTKLAKIKGPNHKNYSSFKDYLREQYS